MNPVVLLGAQALVSLAASAAVLAALSRPLAHTLEITCPDRAAADFWLRYAQTMLVIAPLVLVLAMNKTTGTSAMGAWIYLGARLLYIPAYHFGLAPWRTLIWFVGFFATMAMLIAALV